MAAVVCIMLVRSCVRAAGRTRRADRPTSRARGSHRILGVDRYRRLALSHGDAGQGRFPSIPLNAEGRKVANAWDPAKDEAAGEQCKSYGAGNIMRTPGRIHITWQDDNTLKVEMDNGEQTRLFPLRQGGSSQRRSDLARIIDRSVAVSWRPRSAGIGSAGRVAQGCDHAHAARILAKERRAL